MFDQIVTIGVDLDLGAARPRLLSEQVMDGITAVPYINSTRALWAGSRSMSEHGNYFRGGHAMQFEPSVQRTTAAFD